MTPLAMAHAQSAAYVLAAYAMGTFCTGFVVVRLLAGDDLRRVGSGNIGARNAGRVLGPPGFLLTFGGDFAKGALAVLAARLLEVPPWVLACVMVAVVIGHIWPLWLRFQGGKGLATWFGVIAALDPRLLIAFGAVFVLTFAILRGASLAALIAQATSPIVAFALDHLAVHVAALSVLVVIVLAAHRTNLRTYVRRLRGEADSDGGLPVPAKGIRG